MPGEFHLKVFLPGYEFQPVNHFFFFRSLRMNMMQAPTNMKEPGRSKIITTIVRKELFADQLTN